jgi:hypothetical protein
VEGIWAWRCVSNVPDWSELQGLLAIRWWEVHWSCRWLQWPHTQAPDHLWGFSRVSGLFWRGSEWSWKFQLHRGSDSLIATAQQSQDRRKRPNSVSCQYRGFWKWARARGSCVGQGERLPNVACYCNGWRACKSLWHVAYILWQCHHCPVFWELWSCKSRLQKCRAFLKRSVVQVSLQMQKGGLSPRITGSRGVLKRV